MDNLDKNLLNITQTGFEITAAPYEKIASILGISVNETLLRLAERTNIVGVKDSCGDIKQSLDLIFKKPESFSLIAPIRYG